MAEAAAGAPVPLDDADESVAVAAPAKINLYLHVTGRRPDGYHLLDSLVVFAGAADEVRVGPARRWSLSIDGPFAGQVPAGPENLVCLAAAALAGRLGIEPRVAVRLTKNLPAAGGIGGGSADAAAVLRALCVLWDQDPNDPSMAELALELGADVPACLACRPLFFGGIGEQLAPAPKLPAVWLVLVNPGVRVSTPAVFGERSGPYSAAGRFAAAPPSAAALAAVLAGRTNDLTAPALALAPAIVSVLEALEAAPDCHLARMSGSGATCFGLFDGPEPARRAAGAIARDHADWWVEAAPMLVRPPQIRRPGLP